MTPHPALPRLLPPALLVTLLAWSTSPAWAQSTTDQLPRPRPTSQELSQACVDTPLEAESPNARDRAFERLMFWAGRHLPRERWSTSARLQVRGSKDCTDWNFVVRQWQRANGNPETGRLSSAEASAVEDAFSTANRRVGQIRDEQAQCRDKALRLFGLPMGCTLPPEVPECAFDWNPATAAASCIEVAVETGTGRRFAKALRFPGSEQPNWVWGPVALMMVGDQLQGLRIEVKDLEVAVPTVSSRLGEPSVGEHQPNNILGQPGGMITRSWTWVQGDVRASVTTQVGSAVSPVLTISTESFRRAEAEARQQQQIQRQQPQGARF